MRVPVPGILCAFAAYTSWVSASTVEPMPLARLADHAAAVCDGIVESVQSKWLDNPREIVTEIRLTNVTYWKGNPTAAAPANLTLTVPGGSVGTMTMRIAGAPEFVPGQRWVLFVLPEYRTFPIVGLSQGAFRVIRDAEGTARVADVQGRPIVSLDDQEFLRATDAAVASAACVHAEGMRLVEKKTAISAGRGVTLDEFRALVGPALAASRVHSTTTLGRRIPTRPVATTLIRAPSAHQNGPAGSGVPQAIRELPSAPKATTVQPSIRGQKLVQPNR